MWMLRALWLVVAHDLLEYRWRQNVVKTTLTHSPAARVPLLCFYNILTSSVIYYWTDARQHESYLLSRSNKQNTTIKGKTWSRGTNSREPFGVNVNLNLSNISNKESEYISQKLHLYMRVCIAQRPLPPPPKPIINGSFQFFHHNGRIVTINNWPTTYAEACALRNLWMTLNKSGYSGIFELNNLVYFTWGVRLECLRILGSHDHVF